MENLEKTWGIRKYNPINYLLKLEKQTEIYQKQNNKKIKIAIIDTWIDSNHPDLKWQVLKWQNFINPEKDTQDDQWHWTHIAWTISSKLDWKWILWINPYSKIIPLKICDKNWFCPNYAVIKALEYIKENDIDIVNMSLWWRWNPNNNPICDWIKSATRSWKIIVSASWNWNTDTRNYIPWWCEETISVAAIDESNTRASFSNYWNKVDINAPWVSIYSTFPTNKWNYRRLSWTSMATPHIVWLVSIIKSYKPNLTTRQARQILQENSTSIITESNKPISKFASLDQIILSLEWSLVEREKLKVESEETVENGIEEKKSELEENKGKENEIEKEEYKEETSDEIKQEQEIEEKVEEGQEEKVEEEKIEEEQVEIQKAVLVDQIELVENKELFKDEEIEEIETENNILPNYVQEIDFWEKSDLELNNLAQNDLIFEEIEEQIELKKEINEIPKIQNFDENWELINSNIEINNNEEFINEAKAELLEYGTEPTIDKDILELEDLDMDLWLGESEEIYIDWAEKWVEINSDSDDIYDDYEIGTYSEMIDNEELYDENGDIVDIYELEDVDFKEEQIEQIKHTKELYIDWAEKWVEINNIWENDDLYTEENFQELEVKNYNPNEIIDSFSWSLELWEKLENKEVKIEKINDFYDNELVIGEENWIKINNLDESIQNDEVDIIEFLKFEEINEKGNQEKEQLSSEEEKEMQDYLKNNNSEIWKIKKEEIEIIENYEDSWLEINNLSNVSENNDELDLSEEELEELIKQDEGEEIEPWTISQEELEEIEKNNFLNDETWNIEINSFWEENLENENQEYWEETDEWIEQEIEQEAQFIQEEELTQEEQEEEEKLEEKYGDLLEEETIQIEDKEIEEYIDEALWDDQEGGLSINSYVRTYNRTIRVWQQHNIRLYRKRRWNIRVYNRRAVQIRKSKWYYHIYGKRSWITRIKVYHPRTKRLMYKVNLRIKPKNQTFKVQKLDIKLQDWRTSVKKLRGSRYYRFQVSDSKVVRIVKRSNDYILQAKNPWTTYIKILDRYWNLRYIIKFTSMPLYTFDVEIYKWQTYKRYLKKAYRENYSISDNSLVDLSKGYRGFTITAKEIWTTYIRVSNKYIIKLIIKPDPEVIKYDLNIKQWEYSDLILKTKWRDLKFYYYSLDGWKIETHQKNWDIKLLWKIPWKLRYRVYDQNIHLYTIDIMVHPKIEEKMFEVYNSKKKCIEVWIETDYSTDNEELAELEVYEKGYCITWKKDWELELYVKTRWYHVANHKIKIIPLPEPKQYDINIEEWKNTSIFLPWNYYSYNSESDWNVVVRINELKYRSWNKKLIRIYWEISWNIKYYISDPRWIVLYVLNVKVIPVPPKIIESEIYQTKSKYFSLSRARNYRFSKSSYKWNTSAGKYGFRFYATIPWKTEIYLKDSLWRHLYTYKITVIPKPEPKKYSIKLPIWKNIKYYLPENITRYEINAENRWHNYNVSVGRNYIFLKAKRNGKSIIQIKEKSWNRWEKYILEIEITPEERQIEIIVWEEYKYKNYNKRYYKNLSPSYLNITKKQSPIRSKRWYYIKWLKIWIWKLAVYDWSQIKTILNYKIKSNPKTKHLNCTTYTEWECIFQIPVTKRYSYTQSKSWLLEIETWYRKLKVKVNWSWDGKIYVLSRWGWYHSHIITVKWKQEPAKEYICEIPKWTICKSYWYWRNKWYSYKVSESWIVSLRSSFSKNNKKTQKLYIGWKEEWETEVYIYKLWEHRATIKVKILKEPRDIKLTKWSIKLKQRESNTIEIIDWNWKYKKEWYDKDIVYVNIEGNKNDIKRKIKLKWKKSWRTSVRVVDKYNRTKTISVLVKDTRLVLWNYKKTQKVWELQEISIYDYYWWIKKISKSYITKWVDADVYTKSYKTWEKMLIIKWKREWILRVELEDSEPNVNGNRWNIATLEIEILWGNPESWKDSDEEGKNENTKETTNEEKNLIEIEYFIENLIDEIIWGFKFKINTNPKTLEEVWIEYQTKNWEIKRQKLEKREDRIYIVWYSKQNCEICNNFKPYIKRNNKITYYKERLIARYDNTSIANIESKTKEQPTKQEIIQINSTGYTEFLSQVKLIRKWKKYDEKEKELKKELYDLKEEYWNTTSIIVSLIPILWEWYDILTLVIWKDPITGDELWTLWKTLTIIWLASGAWSWLWARELLNKSLEKLSKELWMKIEEILEVAKEIAKEYKLDDIEDIVRLKDKLSLENFLKKVREQSLIQKSFKWVKYVKDVRKKVEWKIDHIVEINVYKNPKWWLELSDWVHSQKAITHYNKSNQQWVAKLEDIDKSIDTWNEPYSAKVVIDYGNNNTLTKKWWKPVWNSSFFPDSWSKQKIIDEVTYAIENNKGLADPNATWLGLNIFKWPSTVDGINIEFVYIERTKELRTFYPIID